MVSVPTHLRSDTGSLKIAELTIWPRHSKVRGVATLTERKRIATGRAAGLYDRGDAVDLEVELARPSRHRHEDPRRRESVEIARIDLVDDRKARNVGAVDVALEDVVH